MPSLLSLHSERLNRASNVTIDTEGNNNERQDAIKSNQELIEDTGFRNDNNTEEDERKDGKSSSVYYSSLEEQSSDFDDEMIFALTPETCPGPSPCLGLKPPVRIFVATWNMAAKDPFAHRKRGRYIGDSLASKALRELLPLGYDIYVIGTQEKVTKHLDAAVLARLDSARPYQRLELSSNRGRRHLRMKNDSSLEVASFRGEKVGGSFCSPDETNASFDSGEDMVLASSNRKLAKVDTIENGLNTAEQEIRGHGDHALIRRKATGLSIYYATHLEEHLKMVTTGSHKFKGSKGGVAVTIRMAGDPQTLTFVNCHLEANRIERRRRQLDKLAQALPRSLGLSKNDEMLAKCSDHVIWMGDFNYRIKSLDSDDVLQLLSAGRLQELHDQYDSMADDLKNVWGLNPFREPLKWPTFYPTYKKVPFRARLPLSGSTTGTGKDTHWAQHVYKTTYREPFYKGGRRRERVPGWCDRILYTSRTPSPWSDCLKVEQALCAPANGKSLNYRDMRDNYRSLNDELRGSDHSPVTCTFLWSVMNEIA